MNCQKSCGIAVVSLKDLLAEKDRLDGMEVNFLEEGDSAYVRGERVTMEIERTKKALLDLGFTGLSDLPALHDGKPFSCPSKLSFAIEPEPMNLLYKAIFMD